METTKVKISKTVSTTIITQDELETILHSFLHLSPKAQFSWTIGVERQINLVVADETEEVKEV